jgi:UDP-glucuronate 4-epimerase
MHVLVTGGAGFIGSHLVNRLLGDGCRVSVIDNFDPLYPEPLKRDNIRGLQSNPRYRLFEFDIRDLGAADSGLPDDIDVIVHLAAKAGIRPSIENPVAYVETNILGTQALLDFARRRRVSQFVFASSSSVYGVNPNAPWAESDADLQPISPYAATKLAGEQLGAVSSRLYGIRFIALRLFTVYGPRQRPDLAIRKLAELMLRGEPVPIYGDGSTSRDYTFVDDIIEGILSAIRYTGGLYEIVNLGNSTPIRLLEMVRTLEDALNVKARLHFCPEMPGDVPTTFANIDKARRLFGYKPRTRFSDGITHFAAWLRDRPL